MTHKARMANKKMARRNVKPSSGVWKYKTSRASEETKLDEGKESVSSLLKPVTRKPAKAVQRRIDGVSLSVDLGRREDRSMIGYNYLEYVR